jgi:hypothetical protein
VIDWHVGQKVVCIYGGPWVIWPTGEDSQRLFCPREGVVYQIAGINLLPPEITLRLEEFRRDLFSARCFRPIVERKTSIEVFKGLLVPKPALEDA